MNIDENKLDRLEQLLNNVRIAKGPQSSESDAHDSFSTLIQQAEYDLWRLRGLKKYQYLANQYYDYKRKYRKATTGRLWLTYIGFSLAYFALFFCYHIFFAVKFTDPWPLAEALTCSALASFLVGGIHFVVSFLIYDNVDFSDSKSLVLTYGGITLAYLISIFWFVKITILKNADIVQLVTAFAILITISQIIAAIYLFVNNSIWGYLRKKDVEESDQLLRIECEISKINRDIIPDNKPIADCIQRWQESIDYCINELTAICQTDND